MAEEDKDHPLTEHRLAQELADVSRHRAELLSYILRREKAYEHLRGDRDRWRKRAIAAEAQLTKGET
jgi:hypothetical protein